MGDETGGNVFIYKRRKWPTNWEGKTKEADKKEKAMH